MRQASTPSVVEVRLVHLPAFILDNRVYQDFAKAATMG
jgi:hypothetical protein